MGVSFTGGGGGSSDSATFQSVTTLIQDADTTIFTYTQAIEANTDAFWVDGSKQQREVAYTINYETQTITLTFTPVAGAVFEMMGAF